MCKNRLVITIYGSMMGKLVNTRDIRVMEGIYRRHGMKNQCIRCPLFPTVLHFNGCCKSRAYLLGQISHALSLLEQLSENNYYCENTVKGKYFWLMDLGD